MARYLLSLLFFAYGTTVSLSKALDISAASEPVVVGSLTFSMGPPATIPISDCPCTKSTDVLLAANHSTLLTVANTQIPTDTPPTPETMTTTVSGYSDRLVHGEPKIPDHHGRSFCKLA